MGCGPGPRTAAAAGTSGCQTAAEPGAIQRWRPSGSGMSWKTARAQRPRSGQASARGNAAARRVRESQRNAPSAVASETSAIACVVRRCTLPKGQGDRTTSPTRTASAAFDPAPAGAGVGPGIGGLPTRRSRGPAAARVARARVRALDREGRARWRAPARDRPPRRRGRDARTDRRAGRRGNAAPSRDRRGACSGRPCGRPGAGARRPPRLGSASPAEGRTHGNQCRRRRPPRAASARDRRVPPEKRPRPLRRRSPRGPGGSPGAPVRGCRRGTSGRPPRGSRRGRR